MAVNIHCAKQGVIPSIPQIRQRTSFCFSLTENLHVIPVSNIL